MSIERFGSSIIYNGEMLDILPDYNDLISSSEEFQSGFKDLIASHDYQSRVIVHPFYMMHGFESGEILQCLNSEEKIYFDRTMGLLHAIVEKDYPLVIFESANAINSFVQISRKYNVDVNLTAENICTVPTAFNSPTPFMDGDQMFNTASGGKSEDLLDIAKILHQDFLLSKAIVGGRQFQYGSSWKKDGTYPGYTNEPLVANTGKHKGEDQEVDGCVGMVTDALRSAGIEVKISNIAIY